MKDKHSKWKQEKIMADQASPARVSWRTYVLIVIFGLGSWISVNGLWVELPVLVESAPEKWDLPSYLTVIVQLANVGPLAFSIGSHFAPRKVTEKPVICLIVSFGTVACVLLAFLWDKTSEIAGVTHSTALLVLAFFLAIVDCTSSVVFLTFMGSFPSSYMSALFVGETLSGMLPSFVALGQGISRNGGSCNQTAGNATSGSPHSGLNFGPGPFFAFLTSMMIACGAAFWGLNHLTFARRQQIRRPTAEIESKNDDESQVLVYKSSDVTDNLDARSGILFSDSGSFSNTVYLLCIQAWINCLLNGVLPSVTSFATEPYGNQTYHLGESKPGGGAGEGGGGRGEGGGGRWYSHI